MSKSIFCATVLAGALVSTLLTAEEKTLTALFTDRAGPNLYRVTFPQEMGGFTLELPIVGGEFSMALDAEAQTSKILSWHQDVAALDLFGANTGPITVSLDTTQPSSGDYNAGLGAFNVAASFILEFENSPELAQVGFISPFSMSATERGTYYGLAQLATISMYVEGTVQTPGGELSYTCQTSAEAKYDIPPTQGQPGDVNHDRAFDISDPLAAIGYLFLGSTANCPGAINVNGDDSSDLSDAVFMLGYLFQGGEAPPTSPVECGS
jgi:hypothetical protein